MKQTKISLSNVQIDHFKDKARKRPLVTKAENRKALLRPPPPPPSSPLVS